MEEDVEVNAGDGSPPLWVKIRELPMADGVFASTGCQLWSASVLLAKELLRRPELVARKRVVEVGAGCGLAGIVAARFARRTLLTDGDEEVVQNLTRNLCANETLWRAGDGESPREASTRRLRWEEVLKGGWPPEECADVVIASDIIYGHWGETVAQALLRLLSPGGEIILVASEDRRSGIAVFKEHLRLQSYRVAETKVTEALGKFRLYECRQLGPDDDAELCPPVVERHAHSIVDPTEAGEVAQTDALGHDAQECAASEEAGGRPAPTDAAEAAVGAWPEGSSGAAAAAVAAGAAAAGAVATAAVCWKVVGGLARGGIIVRALEAAGSQYLGRLAHGALVEEVERTELRLRYSKLDGYGPDAGWVCFKSGKGATLLALA